MTEKKIYRCDICGVFYNNPEEARKCEVYHVGIMSGAKRIKDFYKGINQGGCDQYPYKVLITMSDGAQIEYKR